MRTTLELPDPLFARLKARAAREQVTLKQLLRTYVEQGLAGKPPSSEQQRSRRDLPLIAAPITIAPEQLSNAGLFALLEE